MFIFPKVKKVNVTQPCLALQPHGLQHPQAPLSMEFSRQEYQSGLSLPSPKDLADPGIKLGLLNCRRILCHLNHQGTDDNYAPFSGSSIVVISFSMGSTTKSIELCYQKLYRLPSKSKEI